MPALTERSPAAAPLDPATLGDHLDGLLRTARSLCGSPSDAEDLVQDVCVRVLTRPRVVHGNQRAYLNVVLRNTFASECRSRARRRTVPLEPAAFAQLPGSMREDPELRAQVREIHGAIAALPPHHRSTLLAVDVLGMSYADAAAALGVPCGTLMSRLHRGRAAAGASLMAGAA